jgi:multicomponent K+:H+ antiporter subunit E
MSNPSPNNSLPNHSSPNKQISTRRWLPHPLLSFFMVLLWLLLVNEINPGQIFLGAILAWIIPYLTQDFWPESTSLRRPAVVIKFVVVVLWDILVANVVLAVRILRPVHQLKPAFMVLPLEVEQDFTITLLASTISLTPGTVSADLSSDRRTLLIHSLHVTDIDSAIAEIKQRYETPLKEIFECCN